MAQSTEAFSSSEFFFQHPGAFVLVVLIFFAIALIQVLCNAGLTYAVNQELDDQPCSFSQAMREIDRLFTSLLGWTVLDFSLGVILRTLQERLPWLGRLFAWLGQLAWAAATIFVIPVLLFEKTTPTQAVRRSGELLVKTWGENVVLHVSLSVVAIVLVFIEIFVGFVLLMMLPTESILTSFLLGGLVLLSIILTLMTIHTLTHIFRVMLYRYATGKSLPMEIDQPVLEKAFGPRRRRGRG